MPARQRSMLRARRCRWHREFKQGTTEMLERTVAFLGVPICAVALTWAAWADEVPPNYLPGTWAIGGADACKAPATERITFNADGTFEAVRGGQPTATGFWHLVEDVLDLHMVSSPAFFDDPTTDFDDAVGSGSAVGRTARGGLLWKRSRRRYRAGCPR